IQADVYFIPCDKSSDALFNFHPGLITYFIFQSAGIGIGPLYIPWLHRQHYFFCLFATRVFYGLNKTQKRYGLVVTDVEQSVWDFTLWRLFINTNNTFYDIVDIGE